jgi:lysozyme
VSRKKKRTSPFYLIKILISLIIALVTTYGIIWFCRRSTSRYYPGFQIELPTGYKIHGIDVSKYQSDIDWQAVKRMQQNGVRIGFVYIKATEGVGNVDKQFRYNWLKAMQQNIYEGAYHYFIAGKSGKRQAANFIEAVTLKKGDLPPVLDIEKTFGVGPEEIRKEVGDWLDIVQKYYGVKPVIYTNIDFYTRYLQNEFNNYPIWIAHYLHPLKPRINHDWVFWQHSESGRVDGINTPVDFSVFAGDSTDFKNLLIQ